jgi:hypothetical protein
MEITARNALLSMPTDIQETVWRNYHAICVQDLISHAQHHLHKRLMKELKINVRMCVLEIDEGDDVAADEFPNWFFQDIEYTESPMYIRNWINDGEPSFDKWWTEPKDVNEWWAH